MGEAGHVEIHRGRGRGGVSHRSRVFQEQPGFSDTGPGRRRFQKSWWRPAMVSPVTMLEGGFVGHAGPNENTRNHSCGRGCKQLRSGGDVFKTDDFPIGEPLRPNTIGGIPGPHGNPGELPKPVGSSAWSWWRWVSKTSPTSDALLSSTLRCPSSVGPGPITMLWCLLALVSPRICAFEGAVAGL